MIDNFPCHMTQKLIYNATNHALGTLGRPSVQSLGVFSWNMLTTRPIASGLSPLQSNRINLAEDKIHKGI